jgi:hypothetical protein
VPLLSEPRRGVPRLGALRLGVAGESFPGQTNRKASRPQAISPFAGPP